MNILNVLTNLSNFGLAELLGLAKRTMFGVLSLGTDGTASEK